MLEKIMKAMLKKTILMILKTHNVDSSKLTDEHIDALWKISESTEGEDRDEKLQAYLKAHIL